MVALRQMNALKLSHIIATQAFQDLLKLFTAATVNGKIIKYCKGQYHFNQNCKYATVLVNMWWDKNLYTRNYFASIFGMGKDLNVLQFLPLCKASINNTF